MARKKTGRIGRRRASKAIGSSRFGFDRGYREGFAKGYEDAYREGYRTELTAPLPPNEQDPPAFPQVELLPPSDKPVPSAAEAHLGILYVCTGKYHVFWEDFYKSAETFLLPGTRKTYFVLTDAPSIYADTEPQVRRIHHDNLGWPGNTLMRYAMFRNLEGPLLQDCDYVYFFNANMQFLETIQEEFLPGEEGLVAVNHPGFYNQPTERFTYERNPASLAYIPYGTGVHYFMGGLTGGRTVPYINMVRELDARIQDDSKRGITALWHDESHLNRYLLDHPVKVLEPSYGYAEEMNLPFRPIILIRDKQKWGGHDFLRA